MWKLEKACCDQWQKVTNFVYRRQAYILDDKPFYMSYLFYATPPPPPPADAIMIMMITD